MFDLVATSASTLIGGSETWWPFLIILLLVFGLFLILAGLFTAYFGSGKSRSIGVALLVVGLVVGLGSAYWYHAGIATPGSGVPALFDLIGQAFLVILAAAVGALIAIAIFLVAIMKS